ncbi:MAG TPA: hypothetical protein VK629_07455 [Steroidobacteraceae bacterium]|nr:hypothetical protein [Steroidobacteraceae bacterium]
MKTSRRHVALAVLCTLGYLSATAEDVRLEGSFVNPSRSDTAITAAIDKSVADFNFIARPIARSRLKKANPPITKAAFFRDGAGIVVTLGIQKPARAAPGGSTVKWTRDDGETFDVAFSWEGATLVQAFTASDGIRYNRYALSGDGNTLTVDVTLRSDMLKIPVNYQFMMSRQINNDLNK